MQLQTAEEMTYFSAFGHLKSVWTARQFFSIEAVKLTEPTVMGSKGFELS